MPTSISIAGPAGKPGQVYYKLQKDDIPIQSPDKDEVVVKISAAALNHRDLFIRQHLYPGTTFGVPLLADGSGTVVDAGSTTGSEYKGKAVILCPSIGWESDVEGEVHAVLGGTKHSPIGTLQEYVTVPVSLLEPAPSHLSAVEAAALPLTGLTAWRALFTKSGNAIAGRNILVTGIGGGVALMALAFGVAAGCNVFVTSGSEDKLQKARELGAKGGVNYKEKDWEKKLNELLPADRGELDAVIDGAGGDIFSRVVRILRVGGTIVSYGMTLGPMLQFPMSAVLKNIDLRGSTMGSRKEFADMIAFVNKHKIRPVISRVVQGIEDLDKLDALWDDMKAGKQFGKLVIEVNQDTSEAKL